MLSKQSLQNRSNIAATSVIATFPLKKLFQYTDNNNYKHLDWRQKAIGNTIRNSAIWWPPLKKKRVKSLIFRLKRSKILPTPFLVSPVPVPKQFYLSEVANPSIRDQPAKQEKRNCVNGWVRNSSESFFPRLRFSGEKKDIQMAPNKQHSA